MKMEIFKIRGEERERRRRRRNKDEPEWGKTNACSLMMYYIYNIQE